MRKANLPRYGAPTHSTKTKKRRLKRSPLRKTLAKLRLLEDKCIDNIKTSVEGGQVDKEVLGTSRWVVNSYVTLAKAIVQEELDINSARLRHSDGTESSLAEEEDSEMTTSRFSLHVLPTPSDV